jgi:alkanesulfonate monooxygenase SsuD/methylene tetrahydromethanopterin reductase-like flavin-dependent oxidoreductase (luciferase family)
MAEWGDGLGVSCITMSEHHGSPDGNLPSPLPALAAMATRTKNARLQAAALVAPFHDPIRLAEQIAVVDLISGGRLDIVIGGGFSKHDFEMFGVDMSERPKRITELVTTLRQAFTGEPFQFRGRTVRVTPMPHQPGGPAIMMGGNSEPAARRAARIGDGFVPSLPECWDFYRDELVKLGKPDPGPLGVADSTHVSLTDCDPDTAWKELAPYFLHEWNAHLLRYADPFIPETNPDVLKASGRYRVLTPEQYLQELEASHNPFPRFNPMCGGIPPELGWRTLRLFEERVLPHLLLSTEKLANG